GIHIPVTDAKIFIDGFGITHGDSIQLEGQAQLVEITGIDYASNVITVSQHLSWEAGAGISSAYSGAAPDIGSFEFEPLVSGTDILSDTEGFALYPNPASDVLHVHMDKGKLQRIEIFNYLGIMVRQETSREAAVFDIADLPTGVYFVRCDNSNLPVQRFVKS
ncbi:MAG: T9SS type A sorting domain-containing protein, partial [Saprospiraceae bacterium]|nr:T9SS type A sorting domain-containing protein [Saprospiraceae bacterium]